MKKILIAVVISFLPIIANAALYQVKIQKVGCHTNSNVCFAYVDKPITTNCPSNDGSFRWDASSENGKSILSILLSAHATDKIVQVGESGCYSNFPSFTYAIITTS